jgi:hypothetical protein
MTQIRSKGSVAHACYKDVYKEKKRAIEQTFRDASLKKLSHGPKLYQRNETNSQKVFHYPVDEVSLHLEVLDNNSLS